MSKMAKRKQKTRNLKKLEKDDRIALALIGIFIISSGVIYFGNPSSSGITGYSVADNAKADVQDSVQNSCSNSCGSNSLTGSCWCDDECAQYGDCCSDKAQVCG